MGNKKSSAKKLMCVLCASLHSIVGTSLARDRGRSRRRVMNYQGTKFQFLRNMGGLVRQKKKKGFIEGTIETVTGHPIASAAVAVPSAWAIAKGLELAGKDIYRKYFKWFEYPEYYGYLYNCFNLAYGRISEIFSACKKNSGLNSGVGKVLCKLCGEEGIYDSVTGEIRSTKKLTDISLDDICELDGALFLLSGAFSTGKMKNDKYYHDVIQNLKKIFPGCSVHDDYKSFSKAEDLDSKKISSRVIVKDNRGYGRFARFAAGYGRFNQKLPFNPFPLIYLIREYILRKCLPESKGDSFEFMVSCDKVGLSDSNQFVKDYGKNGKVYNGDNETNENYLSIGRTDNKLTITFWLATKGGVKDVYAAKDKAKRVECTYTIPSGNDKEVSGFDKRWSKPEFVHVDPLSYDDADKLFK